MKTDRAEGTYKPLSITAAIILTIMALYEWIKQLVHPGITVWQSHAITIIFSTAVATCATYFVLRRYTSLRQQTDEEIALRRTVEQSRDELLTKTGQLVQMTRELESEVLKHRQTADYLRESRHFNEKILDTTPDMIYIYDIQTSRIVYSNKHFNIFAGLTEDRIGEMGSRPLGMLLLREDEKGVADLVDQLRMGPAGTVVEREIEVFDEHHQSRWVRTRETAFSWTDRGQLHLVLSVAQDVTKEKNNQRDRERLAAAIDGIAEGIVVMSGDGDIQYANRAACAILGETEERITGSNIRTLKTAESIAFAQIKWWDILVQTGRTWSGRMHCEKERDPLSEIEVTISPIHPSGVQVNYVVICRDVSEEARLELQLRRAQKMEALATLSGGIAHDFNNILTAVVGFADLALDDKTLKDSTRRFVQHIASAGRRGADIVRDILTMSRRTEEKLKPTLIGPIIRESGRLLRASLPATIAIVENISAEALTVQGDASQIQQVLMNLCTNAAHAMKNHGGVLRIGLEKVQFHNHAQVPHLDLRKGKYARLTVADDGTGIAPDIMERIFDPFFTTKRPDEGTGLGLAMVHGIMKNHRGAVTVSSELGKGSVFEAYWPLIDTEAEVDKEYDKMVLPSGTETILFVDDETAIVEMTEQTLKRLGYTVFSTTNSLQALEIFTRSPNTFDLVMTDQTMPQLTGVELTKKILAIRPEIHIILVTGFSEVMDQEGIERLGISDYLIKPITRRDMAGVLRRVLDKAKASAK